MDTQVEVLFGTPQMDFMDTDMATVPSRKRYEYLKKYGRLLHGCIERLLLLILQRANRFIQEQENRLAGSVDRYCKAIADTLDYTELEAQVCSVFFLSRSSFVCLFIDSVVFDNS